MKIFIKDDFVKVVNSETPTIRRASLAPLVGKTGKICDISGNQFAIEIKPFGCCWFFENELEFANSSAAYNSFLGKVNTKYGSPMGRPSYGEKPTNKRVYDRAVPIPDGYDKGGAYWGHGEPLRVQYTLNGQYCFFYRVEKNGDNSSSNQ